MSTTADLVLQEIVDKIGVKSFLHTHCNIDAKCYNSSALILCLWHSENHASLGLYLNSGRGGCFTCGEKASLIKIYAKVHNLTHAQAIEKLSEEFGGSHV